MHTAERPSKQAIGWRVGCALVIVGISLACAAPEPYNPRQIYTVTRWTVSTSCVGDGSVHAISPDDRFSVNEDATDDAGATVVIVATCSHASESSCLSATSETATNSGVWRLTRESADVYSGSVVHFNSASPCEGYVETRTLRFMGSGTSRTYQIELRHQPFTVAPDATCGEMNARVTASISVCDYLEVIGGTYEHDLDEPRPSSSSSSYHHHH